MPHQFFTDEEVANFKSPYTQVDIEEQAKVIAAFALRLENTDDIEELGRLREEVLAYLSSLGPDDNTYDLIVDRKIDSDGLVVLIDCEDKITAHPEYSTKGKDILSSLFFKSK